MIRNRIIDTYSNMLTYFSTMLKHTERYKYTLLSFTFKMCNKFNLISTCLSTFSPKFTNTY